MKLNISCFMSSVLVKTFQNKLLDCSSFFTTFVASTFEIVKISKHYA